ncbi:MAG TPA: hypothetical protein VFA39_19935 [Steroidobacteraceae bacterium]|nr:hypothetical protein [Steroidobacteraceae bacterium]
MKIYLDHNVLVGIGGRPRWPDADAQLTRLVELAHGGAQWVLSAIHIYELAGSGDDRNVTEYCNLVEAIRPLWANNPSAVRRDELLCFLASLDGSATCTPHVRPFSDTVAQMWASYAGPAWIGDTFTNSVGVQRGNPQMRERIERAAKQTAAAITTGRSARQAGSWKTVEPIANASLFASLLGWNVTDRRIQELVTRIRDVRKDCPMLAVEDGLTEARGKDAFAPKSSHAPDLQHAMSALSYCDGFVTEDKNLGEHCRLVVRRLGISRQIVKRVSDLIIPGSQIGSAI